MKLNGSKITDMTSFHLYQMNSQKFINAFSFNLRFLPNPETAILNSVTNIDPKWIHCRFVPSEVPAHSQAIALDSTLWAWIEIFHWTGTLKGRKMAVQWEWSTRKWWFLLMGSYLLIISCWSNSDKKLYLHIGNDQQVASLAIQVYSRF